mgnify:CR=1 FL=1
MNNCAIIMCTWKRIEKLEKTFEMLTAQTNQDFTFHIWNNNADISEEVSSIVRKQNITTNVHHSFKNIGGLGRFKMAKTLTHVVDKVIFIDDDQIFDKNMVEIFLNSYDVNSIKSRWAWKFKTNSYKSRYKISDGNVNVHYCGTGGMIVPSWLFTKPEVFQIPEKYQFIEDLWLCFVANHIYKMQLVSIADSGFIRQIEDGLDQYPSLFELKDEFLKYLTEQGWNL